MKHLLKHPEKIFLSEISSRPREGVEKGGKVVKNACTGLSGGHLRIELSPLRPWGNGVTPKITAGKTQKSPTTGVSPVILKVPLTLFPKKWFPPLLIYHCSWKCEILYISLRPIDTMSEPSFFILVFYSIFLPTRLWRQLLPDPPRGPLGFLSSCRLRSVRGLLSEYTYFVSPTET